MNIFISADGTYKLGDYGCTWKKIRETLMQSAMGTVIYTSPEMQQCITELEMFKLDGFLADVYSLGVTVLHIAANRQPLSTNLIPQDVSSISDGTLRQMVDPSLQVQLEGNENRQKLCEMFAQSSTLGMRCRSTESMLRDINYSEEFKELLRGMVAVNPAQRISLCSVIGKIDSLLTRSVVPAKCEKFEIEDEVPNISLKSNQACEIRRASLFKLNEDFPEQEKGGYETFILSRLTTEEREVYMRIGNFRYLGLAKEQSLVLLPRGDMYFGDVNRDRSPNGFGLLLKADATIIEGMWIQGLNHGEGLQVHFNGDSYQGMFEYGEMAGRGIYAKYKGSTYEGEWQHSKRNGHGIEVCTDGAVYEGDFVKGKKEGFGKFLCPNKASYEGGFFNNYFEGQGTYTWADGRIYRGQWKNGKMHGKGVFYWPDGSRYEGDYVDNKKMDLELSIGLRESAIKACGRKVK